MMGEVSPPEKKKKTGQETGPDVLGLNKRQSRAVLSRTTTLGI